jgi:hypothetical protein
MKSKRKCGMKRKELSNEAKEDDKCNENEMKTAAGQRGRMRRNEMKTEADKK